MNLTILKWASTFFVLTGILVAQFNVYPMYIFIHSIGAVGCVELLPTLGKSTIPGFSKGAVTIKITSKTNITSR